MNSSGTAHQPLGCVTIAVGQIMNYYQYPKTLRRNPTFTLTVDWPQVNKIFLLAGDTSNEDLPEYLRFINLGLNIKNGDDNSTTTLPNTINFLNLNGYKTEQYEGFHTQRYIQEIKANRPLYITGLEAGESIGHAFICCGYKATSKGLTIELKTTNSLDIKNYSSNPYTIYRKANGNRVTSLEYFYFNWGLATRFNTWVVKPINGVPDMGGFNEKVKYLTIQKP